VAEDKKISICAYCKQESHIDKTHVFLLSIISIKEYWPNHYLGRWQTASIEENYFCKSCKTKVLDLLMSIKENKS
jgi:hypothetical protein